MLSCLRWVSALRRIVLLYWSIHVLCHLAWWATIVTSTPCPSSSLCKVIGSFPSLSNLTKFAAIVVYPLPGSRRLDSTEWLCCLLLTYKTQLPVCIRRCCGSTLLKSIDQLELLCHGCSSDNASLLSGGGGAAAAAAAAAAVIHHQLNGHQSLTCKDTKHHHVTTTTTYYYKYHDYQHYTITAAAVTATTARGRSRLNEMICPWPLPLQSKIHFSCKMVAILSKWLSSIFGKHTSMCNCTILITSSTLITSSIHKKTNYGTYSMTLMVNSGHFEKWPPNLLRGESWMPRYPKLFRMY